MSKKRTSVRKRSKLQEFFIYFVLLLVVLGLIARPLAKGALFYRSYWGGAVFVPFLLLVAAMIVVVAVMNWKRK
jgi:hypothetical protein